MLAASVLAMGGILLEENGYNIFDTDDGSNFLCDIDTTCRKLTQNEIEIARQVFGDEIDYKPVKIFSRDKFFKHKDDVIASVPHASGNIYLNKESVRLPDLTKKDEAAHVFMHEMTHVWQYQTIGEDGMDKKSNADVEKLKNKMGKNYYKLAIYNYYLGEHANLKDYGLEQQGKMVQNTIATWALINNFNKAGLSHYMQQNCASFQNLTDKLKTALPVTLTTKCPAPKPTS